MCAKNKLIRSVKSAPPPSSMMYVYFQPAVIDVCVNLH